jgi:hypothetical protein
MSRLGLGCRQPGESEADLMDRRARESEARWAAQDRAIAAARAARAARGEPEPQGGQSYYGVGGNLSASEHAFGGFRLVGRGSR